MVHQKLIDRLRAIATLSQEDVEHLSRMPSVAKTLEPEEYIIREGDVSTNCSLLLEGFLTREKIVEARRQILSYHVPGDIPDLHSLHLPDMDHDLRSVGPTKVAFIPHDWLRRALDASPRLTHILWRETLIDAAIFREWVANLGSREALGRVAHLICELEARLAAVGLVEDGTFVVPFTQQSLADACGLSTVHVNRTLQELRNRGLIVWKGKTVTILQRDKLEEACDFQADYLHLRKRI
ncbi:MAG TPA: Crp/Fnr family transcriptional regulator [Bradyrhizobium sp.]|nr:Crp/Fnr family transcriptional regulator [Bradyrhizobium sp.]